MEQQLPVSGHLAPRYSEYQTHLSRHQWILKLGLPALTLMLPLGSVYAETTGFTDIAKEPSMNLQFTRAPSASRALLQQLYEDSLIEPVSPELANTTTPHRTGGFPGVALLDHDNDGDTDIYVTNGPGAANALFSNQLTETGELGFKDLSLVSGADAIDQDSNGVCFGDLDNDGDEDLYVLGRESENHVYENVNGRFEQVLVHGAEAGNQSHISCSMGDINGDGLLDIAVANVFNLDNAQALQSVPYALNQKNQLFLNNGSLTFTDVSETSGIQTMSLGGTDDPQPPTISWAVAMIDIDQDGDTDIVFGDDQAGYPNLARGGFDRGYIQVFLNDGSGQFSNAPIALNENSSAAWMALAFGDLDCNGTLDLFASNLGSYMFEAFGLPSTLQAEATRWLLGNGDGSFEDTLATNASAFGWGNAIADFDNDGDPDIVYHGAMDVNTAITHDNPGMLLENQDCTANFTENNQAFRGDYTLRGTQGVATADLDQDGYVDVVSVSNHTIDPAMPFFISPAQYGSELDASARFYLPMVPDSDTGLLRWTGVEILPGDLAVEINQGHGAGAVSVKAKGTSGLLRKGKTNRSGVGAIVRFTPNNLPTAMVPIVAGSSFTSQHALDAHFGMGNAQRGKVEVLWPGGVRNRLYNVRAGERVVIPEIPCRFDDGSRFGRYAKCVNRSVNRLRHADVITRYEANRLRRSAYLAYFEG